MFTNNFFQMQESGFLDSKITVVLPDASQMKSVYAKYSYNSPGKYMRYGRCRSIVSTPLASSQLATYCGIYFGSGSTPANKNDYTLESVIESGLSISNPSSLVQSNDGNGKYSFSSPIVISNTSDAEININEIGLFLPGGENGSQWYLLLMERTVLTEPITIAPGESKLVEYKLTFNQTMNVE